MPDRTPLDGLSHMLGAIEQQLATITKTQGEDRIASAQYRTDMRADLAKMGIDVRAAASAASINKEAYDRIMPIVHDLERDKLMAIGAGRMAVWIARLGYALVGAGGAFALSVIDRHWR